MSAEFDVENRKEEEKQMTRVFINGKIVNRLPELGDGDIKKAWICGLS